MGEYRTKADQVNDMIKDYERRGKVMSGQLYPNNSHWERPAPSARVKGANSEINMKPLLLRKRKKITPAKVIMTSIGVGVGVYVTYKYVYKPIKNYYDKECEKIIRKYKSNPVMDGEIHRITDFEAHVLKKGAVTINVKPEDIKSE